MSETVIRVENLSKKYTLGKNGRDSGGLRHAIHDYATAPFRRLRAKSEGQSARREELSAKGEEQGARREELSAKGEEQSATGEKQSANSVLSTQHSGLTSTHHSEPRNGSSPSALTPLPSASDFWALKDVSFDVKRGEVVGIIGRNGAGKSTLLKILSRITEPTTGRVGIKGRVASLLEVGTGFHPELTGRENIFLNGAILGMTRAEIKKKFDEIVAFAEVEQFLDTPVKRYSSGMYVRLAFAVAAHLEPEILLVDEVLAVGDAAFQKKCLGKMGDVAQQGRTVLFVSHNMQAVSNLCGYGVYLENGSAHSKTSVDAAITEYSKELMPSSLKYPIDSGDVVLHSFGVQQDGFSAFEYDGGRSIALNMKIELKEDLSYFQVGILLRSYLGDVVCTSLLADWNEEYANMKRGLYQLEGFIPGNFLLSGSYIIEPAISRHDIIDYGFAEVAKVKMQVRLPETFNKVYLGRKPWGVVMLDARWKATRYDSSDVASLA